MENNFYNKLKEVFSVANDIKTEEQIRLEESINDLKFIIKGLLERACKLNVFGDGVSLQEINNIVDEPLKKYIEFESKPWLKEKLTIGFLGHMNSGKTSALNCLFDESFPISAKECTALATYLSYGSNTAEIKLVDKQGDCQTINTTDSIIFDYNLSGGFPYARFFDYIQKENSSEILKNISIIDTPGLFSGNESHSLPTINAIPLCDIIFWFVPIDGEFDQNNLKFIKEHLGEKKLYFVFTFTDNRGLTSDTVDKAIDVALNYAKSEELNVSGFFKFGRKETTKEFFKVSVFTELENIATSNEIVSPIGIVFALLAKTLELITNHCVSLHDAKSEVEKEKQKLRSSLDRSIDSFCNAFRALIGSYSNMIDTFNRRCSGAIGCGGASSAMASHINQCQSKINSLASAYEGIDFNDTIALGNLYYNGADIDNKLAQMEKLKNDFEEILNALRNDD